ncbi:MAG TPA: DUF3365 domain-containing protein [Pelomicrobium sp.]|nr:DUF3365 domain-containing protein [Pelomicrobium sp.]
MILVMACAGLAGGVLAGEQDDARMKAFIAAGREAADMLVKQIGGELRREMEASGVLRGVIVCKYTAPEVANMLSRQTGMRVTRVSLRPRNPALGFPDPWEQKTLAEFERRAANGERPAQLEHWELVNEPQGRFLRYMKAIPTQKLCLNCHGPVEGIPEVIKAQIAAEYPHDRAVGFREGSIRGAVAVKKFAD